VLIFVEHGPLLRAVPTPRCELLTELVWPILNAACGMCGLREFSHSF